MKNKLGTDLAFMKKLHAYLIIAHVVYSSLARLSSVATKVRIRYVIG